MTRLVNWQSNLSKLIEAKRHAPFGFASHNCLMWAGLGIAAVTGTNPVKHHIGAYTTEIAAAKFLRTVDRVKTSQALLEKTLGEARPVAFARPGDIVLVDPTDTGLELPADIELFGPVPGICYGSISFFVGEFGLVEVGTLQLGQALWVS